MNKLKTFFLTLFLFSGAIFTISSECITSENFCYTIDFPEGIQIDEMEPDESIVSLSHKYFQVKTILRIWPQNQYKSSKEALTESMKKLSLKAEISECSWRNLNCSVAMFEGSLMGTESKGWAESIPLPQDKGYLVVMSYADVQVAKDLESVMISILDSVIFDKGSSMDSGLITSVFYPKTGTQDLTLSIGSKTIRTKIDKSDSQANQFVMDREWNIFLVYAQNLRMEKPDQAAILISAWQRFYRLITKDAMTRLKKVSADIYKAFMPELMAPEEADNQLLLTQSLLTWVQEFEYSRNDQQSQKADIANVLEVLNGAGSDCDARSMLMAILLKNMGVDTCFFVSAQYSHALFGANIEGKQGQTIKAGDKEYLTGETTARNITLGKMPADMQNREYWFPVEFYY